jgi:integrase
VKQGRRRKQAAHVAVSGPHYRKTKKKGLKKVWVLSIRRTVGGRRIIERHEYATESAAAKKETLVLKRLDNEQEPFDVERPGVTATVADVLESYRAPGKGSGGLAESSSVSIAYMDEHLKDFFGDSLIERMVPDDLFAYQAARRSEKAADSTIAKELRHFDAAAKSALVNGRIEAHPFARLDRAKRAALMPAPVPQGEAMSDEDFEAAYARVPSKYRAVILFIRTTGLPRGDACELRRDQIRPGPDNIVIEHPGKKRPPFVIPLAAVKHLLPPPRVGTVLVFSDEDGSSLYGGVYDAWVDACRNAGVRPANLHEMGKHSFVTDAAALKQPLDDISAATSTTATTLRGNYLHATEQRAAKVFMVMAKKRSLVGQRERRG